MDSNDKLRYYVSRKNVFVKLSVFFMLLSALCRFLGYWGFWANQEPAFIWFQIALPIASCLLFCAITLYCGRRFFSLTFIPVLMGVLFFIVKAFTFDSFIHTALCILLYLAVAFIYTATVFGVIRTKWLFVPLFGIPLAVHIFVIDREQLASAESVNLAEWLPEISVLCVMLALLLICFAMKKRDFAAERAQSDKQQTIDLLVSNEEPTEAERAAQAAAEADNAANQEDGAT